MRSTCAVTLALVLCVAWSPASAQTTTSTPRPAPRAVSPPQAPGGTSGSQPARPAATPAPAPTAAGAATTQAASQAAKAPTEAELGAPLYPGSVFLGSFNAGQGQRMHLFGTAATFSQVMTFYRATLKTKGEEVFDVPPTWAFDIGRFREQTMAFPPSVTIRDHTAGGERGYLHAAGAAQQRFPTVIQIVPPAPEEARR
jgi:hypothetical protein